MNKEMGKKYVYIETERKIIYGSIILMKWHEK